MSCYLGITQFLEQLNVKGGGVNLRVGQSSS